MNSGRISARKSSNYGFWLFAIIEAKR